MKAIKKIKENITLTEYKKLIAFARGNDTIRENTRTNLQRTFTILFFTGLRLNELQDMKLQHIKELLDNGTTKINLSKTSTERKLYLTPEFKKHLEKLFDINEDAKNRVIAKGSNKRDGIHFITFIQQVNKFMRVTLGSGYTSHSFRQGIITEMGSRSINTKIISKFIGHSDVRTTMQYINPTDDDIMNCLVR